MSVLVLCLGLSFAHSKGHNLHFVAWTRKTELQSWKEFLNLFVQLLLDQEYPMQHHHQVGI